jgi:hypothetical protein
VAETMPWPLGERWSVAAGVLTGDNWADWSQRLPATVLDGPPLVRRLEAGTWVRLHTFEREGRLLAGISPPPAADLTPPRPVTANFGDELVLRGFDAVEGDNQQLEVTLYWQAGRDMTLDYTVFVHLLDEAGQLVAQHDGQPWWEVKIPTSSWLAGETLLDRHTLQLPADLPPGTYRLQAGVYYWETLERLPVLENGVPVNNVVELGVVERE